MNNILTDIKNRFLQKPCPILHKTCSVINNLSRKTIFWVVIHTVLFLGIFTVFTGAFYDAPTPGVIEKIVACNILNGQIPYIDFECEYPPVALLLFSSYPGLIFRTLPCVLHRLYGRNAAFRYYWRVFLIIYIAKRINISKVKALTAYTLLIAYCRRPDNNSALRPGAGSNGSGFGRSLFSR